MYVHTMRMHVLCYHPTAPSGRLAESVAMLPGFSPGQFQGTKLPGYRLLLLSMPLGDRGSATAERYLAAAPTARSCSSTRPGSLL